MVSRVKENIRHPIALGFGISTREQFRQVSSLDTNGVVVGSAIIKALKEAKGTEILWISNDLSISIFLSLSIYGLPFLFNVHLTDHPSYYWLSIHSFIRLEGESAQAARAIAKYFTTANASEQQLDKTPTSNLSIPLFGSFQTNVTFGFDSNLL